MREAWVLSAREDWMGNFLNDAEKMRDFRKMSKQEFLRFYSYLSEREYDSTKRLLKARKLLKVTG